MIEPISWSFTIPAVIILVLICWLIYLLQDYRKMLRTLIRLRAMAELEFLTSNTSDEEMFNDGRLQGLTDALRILEEGS